MNFWFRLPLLVLLGTLSTNGFGQNIKIYNFDQFEHRLNHDSDSLYFVNFWATWCIPCVKEMPAIQEIATKYRKYPLKIILVSMDHPSKIESRLKPFITKHSLTPEVVILDDPDFNSWIDKVEPSWGGAIPAAMLYSKNKRDFYEQSFEFDELDEIINSKLQQL